MKGIGFFILFNLFFLSCVNQANNNRRSVAQPTNPPLIAGCPQIYQPVCGLVLVDNGQDLQCIQPGPGCGSPVQAYAKVSFYNSCAASLNNAHVLHSGACNSMCPEVLISPTSCGGNSGDAYLDYNQSGCKTDIKCRNFPCPLYASIPYVEGCASGQAHKPIVLSEGCGTGFSCQSSSCPREYPIAQPANCSNTGHYNASYNSSGCLSGLT